MLGGFGGMRGNPPPKGASAVIPVSEREFQAEVLGAQVPVLIQFTSERSAAAKAVAAELESFAEEMKDKLKVVSVDIDRSPTIARQLRVQGVPTFMMFSEGRIVDAISGPAKKKQLRDFVEPFLPRPEGALKPREVAELLKRGEIVAIDTREASAFGRAHLPGAKSMPLAEIETRLAELFMLAGQPVLYCRSGADSKELATKLVESGTPVSFLEGGLLAWEAEGLPIER